MVNVWFEYVWVDALDSVENPPVFYRFFHEVRCARNPHRQPKPVILWLSMKLWTIKNIVLCCQITNIKPPIKPPFTQGTQGLVSLLGGILTTVKYLLQIIFPILGGCKKWIKLRHVSTLESKYIPFYPSKPQWYSIIPQKMFGSAMVLFKEFILSSLNSN